MSFDYAAYHKNDRLVETSTATQLAESQINFDIRDGKGRVVGYRWSITEFNHVLRPADTVVRYEDHADHRWLPNHRMAHGFRVWSTPTRDGVNYGPAFNYAEVATYEAACNLVDKRINAARKRDAKKFGKEVAA